MSRSTGEIAPNISTLSLVKHPIVDKIRERSRADYEGVVRQWWIERRIWVQENGEFAAIAGLILGVAIVLFFRVFLLIAILSIIVGGAVWLLAGDGGAEPPPTEPDKLS